MWATGVAICYWTATIRWRVTNSGSMLPAFVFATRPVVPVMDAVRVELEAIAFRDELKSP